MIKYTIGILLTKDLTQVLLIEKLKPEWQKGLLNFPGGKLEKYETYRDCVSREFQEECNLRIPNIEWRFIGEIEGADYKVGVLTARYDIKQHGMAKMMTDEPLMWCPVNELPSNCISNLHWLLPFAMNYWKQGNSDSLIFGHFKYGNIS